MSQPWKIIAKKKYEAVLNAIPKEWRLTEVPSPQSVPNVLVFLNSILPDSENEITSLSATKLASEIAQGKYSAEQVIKAFCKRAAYVHQLTNSCSEIFFDRALQRAKQLDEFYKREKKVVGPFHGVPISLKDQFNVEGIDSAVGFVGLLNKPIPKNQQSLVVDILEGSGAIFYVKGAVPMGMMSAETYSHIYGQTLNSLNRNLSAGGSTGGDAALIAANAAPMAVGTDIGGSVRIPTSFHGIHGLRPSTSRFPYLNVTNTMADQPVMPSVIGPLSKHLEDIDLFAKVVLAEEPWNRDAKVPPIPWKPLKSVLPNRPLTFAFEKWDHIYMPHPPILRAQEVLKKKLKEAGHFVYEWEADDYQSIVNTAHEIYQADDHKDIRDKAALSGEPVIPQIMRPGEADGPPHVKTVPEHWEHARKKYLHQQRILEYWNSTAKLTPSGEPFDCWVSPVFSAISWRPGDMHSVPGSYAMVQNVLDLPSVVIPVTTSDKEIDNCVDPNYKAVSERDQKLQDYYDPELYHGMPASLQLVTRRYQEEKAVALAMVAMEALN